MARPALRKNASEKTHSVVFNRVSHFAYETMTEMTFHYGSGSKVALFEMLCRAWKEGRLLMLDNATREVLVGAAQSDMLRSVREAVRQEVNMVLFERGFISDPHER